ncbi:MAG: hypothetical protein E6I00_06400 [Chloroflexi bacterium]|nr:MAG: hypothetical protein E6I00_06400 [Chloroflexota bacterium]
MRSKIVLIGGLAAAALLATACGAGTPYASSPSTSPSPSQSVAPVAASPTANASAQPTGTTIAVAKTRLGRILVDSNGRTVYLFLADSGSTSNCNSAACVQAWPPVLTKGTPQAGSGANAALLGTTTRRDGKTEVTYAGHPLYYFVSDKKSGDVTGQNINAFGAPWYVVSPSGMQIR